MYPKILQIYGPIAIHSFGLMLAIGVAVFMFLALRDPLRKKFISSEDFINVAVYGLFWGIVAARILFIIQEPSEFSDNWIEIFYFWDGGLSMLGAILALLIFVPFYLWQKNLSVLPLLDLAALYAPVLEVFARIGCFLAGCCYGKESTLPWAVCYTHPDTLAPHGVYIHPTQIYSSLVSLFIFLILYFVVRKRMKNFGEIFTAYLILFSTYRFFMDFVRGDNLGFVSPSQKIAIVIFALGIILLATIRLRFMKRK